MSIPDIIVVGGGPAGLMAAIAAARGYRRVVVHERLARVGAKLLATGGGHCNLTNTLDEAAWPGRFGRQGRFMTPALAALGPARLRGFFADWGVPTRAEDGFHVYPASRAARDVLEALLNEATRLGVEIHTSSRVSGLLLEDGAVRGVLVQERRVCGGAVLLAAGGCGYPGLGGGRDGLALAQQAGHRIVEPAPALAPLVTAEDWPRQLAGVSLADLRLRINLPGQSRAGVCGTVLFTHRGISGPAVLDISGTVARLLLTRKALTQTGVPLRLERVGVTGAEQTTEQCRRFWQERLRSWRERAGRRQLSTHLAGYVPAALAEVLCTLAAIAPQCRMSEVSAGSVRSLVELLTSLPVTITATEGFDAAMVTSGGVALGEVEPRTLASRRCAGLYLAGEMLDLDGPCGGYNLQWAFASGYLAGAAAARAVGA